jgi:hypothetical protein
MTLRLTINTNHDVNSSTKYDQQAQLYHPEIYQRFTQRAYINVAVKGLDFLSATLALRRVHHQEDLTITNLSNTQMRYARELLDSSLYWQREDVMCLFFSNNRFDAYCSPGGGPMQHAAQSSMCATLNLAAAGQRSGRVQNMNTTQHLALARCLLVLGMCNTCSTGE